MDVRKILEKELAGFEKRLAGLEAMHEKRVVSLTAEKEQVASALAALGGPIVREKREKAPGAGRPGRKPRASVPVEEEVVSLTKEEYEKLKGGQ